MEKKWLTREQTEPKLEIQKKLIPALSTQELGDYNNTNNKIITQCKPQTKIKSTKKAAAAA